VKFLPFYVGIECYLALNRYPEAFSALEAVLLLSENNPEFAKLKNWATSKKEAINRVEKKQQR
jgi:hypothetical protein